MSTNYIEEFNVPGIKIMGIEKVADTKYQVWAGGCGVGTTNTLDQARSKVFNYMQNEIQAKIVAARRDLEFYQPLQEKLGNDVFNLAKYKE